MTTGINTQHTKPKVPTAKTTKSTHENPENQNSYIHNPPNEITQVKANTLTSRKATIHTQNRVNQ